MDTRGICGDVDLTDLLNVQCKGKRTCFFVPVGYGSFESTGGTSTTVQVTVPDTCDERRARKLLGTYRCTGTYPAKYAS